MLRVGFVCSLLDVKIQKHYSAVCPDKTCACGFRGGDPDSTTDRRNRSHTPDFFGFPKDRLSLALLPDVEEVGVEFFVIVVYLEECTSVRVYQVFCIYLQHRGGQRMDHD